LKALPNAKSLKETTLGANQWKNENHRMEWITANEAQENSQQAYENTIDSDSFIVMTPMAIKSFVVST